MADLKISALTASTVPLAGTEVLPIVQSSTTKQVSVANLTAGRAISATQLTLTTGNLIVANGQGVDFSATPGTGTSELLNDYEEGTFTATLTASTTAPTTPVTVTAYYTVVGRLVTVQVGFFNVDTTGAVGSVEITGMPFTAASTFSVGSAAIDFGASSPVSYINNGATKILLYASNTLGGIPIVGSAGRYVVASISYLK